VEAILNQFPGSKIVNIRVREEEKEGLEPAPETEDNLNEFFE
jgi:hypothetical protein